MAHISEAARAKRVNYISVKKIKSTSGVFFYVKQYFIMNKHFEAMTACTEVS